MTVDGRIPRGWPGVGVGVDARPVHEPHSAGEVRHLVDHSGAGLARPARPGRSVPPAKVHVHPLHHRGIQNFRIEFPAVAKPYKGLLDVQINTSLINSFSVLEKLNKGGGLLTMTAIRHIASEKTGESEQQDHAIQLANTIINRPRLMETILDRDGCITRQSLLEASKVLFGNSDPAAFSHDPFQAKTNAEVVQAFKNLFDTLRDAAQDRTVFFEKYGYVNIDQLVAMSRDPDQTDHNGNLVLDQATGLAQKQYSEEWVYMTKNLVERPGLLRSLENASANASGMFGSHKAGWLSNKSLDRWLESDKAQKAR